MLESGLRECPVGQDHGLWFRGKLCLTAFIHKFESGLLLDSTLCRQDADSGGRNGTFQLCGCPTAELRWKRPSHACPGLPSPPVFAFLPCFSMRVSRVLPASPLMGARMIAYLSGILWSLYFPDFHTDEWHCVFLLLVNFGEYQEGFFSSAKVTCSLISHLS